MAQRCILKDEHPALRKKTQEVKKINSAVMKLIDDMVETMRLADGVGLAANQVGVPKRILVAADGEEKVYVLINPRLESKEGEEIGLEGCLSVPGDYGEVPRASKIALTALDRAGKELRFEAEGLLARILQHEMDHLDGILFTDKALRMIDPEELKSEEKS